MIVRSLLIVATPYPIIWFLSAKGPAKISQWQAINWVWVLCGIAWQIELARHSRTYLFSFRFLRPHTKTWLWLSSLFVRKTDSHNLCRTHICTYMLANTHLQRGRPFPGPPTHRSYSMPDVFANLSLITGLFGWKNKITKTSCGSLSSHEEAGRWLSEDTLVAKMHGYKVCLPPHTRHLSLVVWKYTIECLGIYKWFPAKEPYNQ